MSDQWTLAIGFGAAIFICISLWNVGTLLREVLKQLAMQNKYLDRICADTSLAVHLANRAPPKGGEP